MGIITIGGDNITLAVPGGSLPNNQKIVNSISDFPDPVGDVITLEDNISYFLGDNITTSSRFVCGIDNTILSDGVFAGSLISTHSGDMFTGTDVNVDFHQCSLGAPNATQLFNFTDTTPTVHVFSMSQVAISSGVKFGTFTDLFGVVVSLSNAPFSTDGMSFIGTFSLLSISRFLQVLDATGIGIDLGTATSLTMEILNYQVAGPPGSIGISGAANSANLISGTVGTVSGCEFLGAVTPLQTISLEDIRWQFAGNSGLNPSSISADTFLTSSQAVSISMQGVYVEIGGSNWSSDITERYSSTTAGLLTYLPEFSVKSLVVMTLTVAKDGGGSDELCAKIAINGTVSDKTISCTENNTPTSMTCTGLFTLSEGDTIQGFVANIDGTTNIVVSTADINVINGF